MIKQIIARGIGFLPGSVKYIVTHGFGISDAVGPDCFLDFIALMDEGALDLNRGFGEIGGRVNLLMENGARATSEAGNTMVTEIEASSGMNVDFGPQTIDLRSVLSDAPTNAEAVICDG